MEHILQARQSGNGSHRTSSNSLSGIISTLVPTLIISCIIFIAFLILRPKIGRVYRPRTLDYVLHNEERRTAKSQSTGSLFSNLKSLPDDYVLHRNSLDGYLYLRFFKLLIAISLVGCLITWPILFPVNATGGGGQMQLDILSFSNVQNPNRYYAHTFVAWIFLGFVMLAITHERFFFVGVRQAYFMSPLRAKRLTSRTVLFMSLPKEYQTEVALHELLGSSVRKIWMVSDCKKLEEIVKNRDKAANKLENGETKMITNAHKAMLKESDKQASTPEKYLKDQKRLTHRLKFLIGKKVDTVDWCRDEIPKLTKEIKQQQDQKLAGSDIVGAAFVEFTSQAAAQKAFQLAAPSKKKAFQPRFIDVQPQEVIFKNLKKNYASRKLMFAIATAIVTLITIFWTPIVAFVGALANINYLTNKVHFLSFINSIPPVILGVVTGLLPVIVLAVCVILVPIICRQLAKLAGAATLSEVELKTQGWYFVFQVIQVFLVTTFVSGAAAVTTQIINNPSSAPTLLAKNLPKASNFYISYFILYGLMQAALQLLLIAPLLMKTIVGGFLDKTPRKQYTRWTSLAGLGWGSEYPKWTNLGVIALSYSCIAPLILGFAAIGFTLLYIAFRNNWLFVFGNNIDMKGEAYAKALRQLTTGIYLSVICLIGLFGMATGSNTASAGPLALMVAFLVILIVYNILLDRAIGPLEQRLPLDMLEGNEASMWTPSNNQSANQFTNQFTNQFSNQPADSSIDPSTHNAPHHHQTTLGDGQNFEMKHEQDSALENGKEGYTPQHEKANVHATDNMLTKRIRPIIHSRFFSPLNASAPVIDSQSKLQDDIKDEDRAYLNPAITSPEPLMWLPRDGAGVSKMLIRGNDEKGVKSTDEFAWLNEKGKVTWDTERAEDVDEMLSRWRTQGGKQDGNQDYATAGGNTAAQLQ